MPGRLTLVWTTVMGTMTGGAGKEPIGLGLEQSAHWQWIHTLR